MAKKAKRDPKGSALRAKRAFEALGRAANKGRSAFHLFGLAIGPRYLAHAIMTKKRIPMSQLESMQRRGGWWWIKIKNRPWIKTTDLLNEVKQ